MTRYAYAVLRTDILRRTTEHTMERRMLMRHEKYWTESGRGDGQDDVEKEDLQLYWRPYMRGKQWKKKKIHDKPHKLYNLFS